MSIRPSVLNFSGNDSAGLAGLAMDLRCQTALGVHSPSVITANTAQNNQHVLSINPVLGQAFIDQVNALSRMDISAIKIGLVADDEQVAAIINAIIHHQAPSVYDPVLNSSSGARFVDEAILSSIKRDLFPLVNVLTPNIDEATQLTGLTIESPSDMEKAAQAILNMGSKAVLIKGGHASFFDGVVADYFTSEEKSFWLSSPKQDTPNTRGTGCALSACVAAALALGYSICDAVIIAKMAVSQGLRESYGLAGEKGSFSIQQFPCHQADLPVLSPSYQAELYGAHVMPESPGCNQPSLGLYPVVDRAQWIAILAPAGVTTIQLRVKDLEGDALVQEIQQAITLAKEHKCRLFINDYWQLAIELGAYGVHLGQEDLDGAHMQKIKAAGLRLGISTHCHYEVARAHFYKPSYIACGPIYHTNTKQMPWVPHGIDGLRYWREVLNYPLVAIGGINEQRIQQVADTGVDSIAMITAITLADDPVATTQAFNNICQRHE